jgi:hypothetical protein
MTDTSSGLPALFTPEFSPHKHPFVWTTQLHTSHTGQGFEKCQSKRYPHDGKQHGGSLLVVE